MRSIIVAYRHAPAMVSSSAVQLPNQRLPWRRKLVLYVPDLSSTRLG
ncbi:hypothetical protein [Rubritalea tangerina]